MQRPGTRLQAPSTAPRTRDVLSAVGLAIAQAAATCVVLGVVGLVVAVLSGPYEDLLSVVGWVFWSAVLAVATAAVVLVLGLPLRLVPHLRAWWGDHGWFLLFGALLGAALVVAAFLAGHPDTVDADGMELAVFQPSGPLLLAGWILLAFSCAHMRWPRTWTRRLRQGWQTSAGAERLRSQP